MLDTKLTVRQIEDSIMDYIGGERTNLAVPNVSYGLLPYEADLLVMNKSGYVTEYEIKRSFSDFMADFKKDESAHNVELVHKFFYVVPISISEKVISVLKDKYGGHYLGIGVLAYNEDGLIESTWGIPIRPRSRKLFIEEQFKLARLGTLRYWSLRKRGGRE